MNIREISVNDAPAWSAMRTNLWPETDDGHMAEITQFLRGNKTHIDQVYVAEKDQQLLGFIELRIRAYAEGSEADRVPYVEGWYVRSEYRGQGVGAALMKQAEQWALSSGFEELASDTDFENERSIQRHAALGFQEAARVVCFIKKLKA